MALLLIKSIKRELLAPQRGKAMVIELEPGDLVTFRVKGKKTRYSVSAHKVFNLALMVFLQENYTARLADYKVKKKYGYKRVRCPKAPNLSMFSKEYLIALR